MEIPPNFDFSALVPLDEEPIWETADKIIQIIPYTPYVRVIDALNMLHTLIIGHKKASYRHMNNNVTKWGSIMQYYEAIYPSYTILLVLRGNLRHTEKDYQEIYDLAYLTSWFHRCSVVYLSRGNSQLSKFKELDDRFVLALSSRLNCPFISNDFRMKKYNININHQSDVNIISRGWVCGIW